MVIVHTTVWIDYLRGVRNPETDWLDAELDRQRVGGTEIILCKCSKAFGMSPQQPMWSAGY